MAKTRVREVLYLTKGMTDRYRPNTVLMFLFMEQLQHLVAGRRTL
jgi:hypothetical protein